MGESLVLIHNPERYGRADASGDITVVEFNRVVGLIATGSKPTMEYGYELTGEEQETDLHLGETALERIADFYEQTRAREPGTTAFYNCHIFVNYVLGKTMELPQGSYWWQGWRLAPAEVNSLAAGEPYGIIDDHGYIAHSLLGIDRPQLNLSVMGDLQPLALSRTEDLLASYDSVGIVRYF